jgi:spore coat protein CotH
MSAVDPPGAGLGPRSRSPSGCPIWRLLPARIRLHTTLIFWSLGALALVVWLLRTAPIRPIVFRHETLEVPSINHDVRGSVDLFDLTVPHEIDVALSEVEYTKMKTDFAIRGEKSWIRADVTIDGTRLESVGIRLKGNSTLMSLRSGRAGGPGGGFPGAPGGGFPGAPGGGFPGAPPGGFSGAPPSLSAPLPTAGPSTSASVTPSSSAAPPRGAAMATVSFDDPSTLPLVLRFDRFVKGRGYQGRTELAVRPVVGTSGAALNEAVALRLIADSGQISQRFTWVRFKLNGAAARTRLVLENPDQNYAVGLGRGEGALFKSKSTNTFTYKGEDATAYTNDYAQLSANGSLDLAPVIGLLRFVTESDDATFDRELPRWVDVDAFAAYVATHDLLGNFDDMSGPGRNFLLWYDVGDSRFTVITWDMNLAISSMGGPGGPGRFGGPGGGMRPPGASSAGAAPWGSGTPPWGSGSPPAGSPLGGFGGPGGPGGARMGNTLKQRFVASAAFAAVRAAARERLRQSFFEHDGGGERVTRALAAIIPTSSTLTPAGIDAERAAVLTRLRALAETAAAPPK